MVVDHADRLHERVHDGRPAELEAARREFLRHFLRQRRFRRHLRAAAEAVDFRLAVEKSPQQLRETRPLLHHFEIGAGGEDRAFDLEPIAHDAFVGHERSDLALVVTRDDFRPEAVERAAEVFALAQDGDPRQAGLEAVEHELLIKRAVAIVGHAPFVVAIGDVERVEPGPRAALTAVGMGIGHASGLYTARPGRSSVGNKRTGERAGVYSAAVASPGKAKRAHSGLTRRSGTPPAESVAPAASASAVRSRRSMASPRPRAAEPMVPTARSPAITGTPSSGANSS